MPELRTPLRQLAAVATAIGRVPNAILWTILHGPSWLFKWLTAEVSRMVALAWLAGMGFFVDETADRSRHSLHISRGSIRIEHAQDAEWAREQAERHAKRLAEKEAARAAKPGGMQLMDVDDMMNQNEKRLDRLGIGFEDEPSETSGGAETELHDDGIAAWIKRNKEHAKKGPDWETIRALNSEFGTNEFGVVPEDGGAGGNGTGLKGVMKTMKQVAGARGGGGSESPDAELRAELSSEFGGADMFKGSQRRAAVGGALSGAAASLTGAGGGAAPLTQKGERDPRVRNTPSAVPKRDKDSDTEPPEGSGPDRESRRRLYAPGSSAKTETDPDADSPQSPAPESRPASDLDSDPQVEAEPQIDAKPPEASPTEPDLPALGTVAITALERALEVAAMERAVALAGGDADPLLVLRARLARLAPRGTLDLVARADGPVLLLAPGPANDRLMAGVGSALQKADSWRYEIVGHAEPLPASTPTSRRRLAADQAFALAIHLIRGGLDQQRMSVGDSPRAPGSTPSGRVEIRLLPAEAPAGGALRGGG